jgi:peptidoglycan/LPS O-acetylase OafA/YrhL
VFGVGMLCFSKRGFRNFAIAIVVLSVAVLLAFGARLGDLGNLPRCLSGFFFGCLTRAAIEGLRDRTLQRDWPTWILALAALLLALPWHSPTQGATWFEQLAMPIAALLIVTLVLTPSSRLNRVLLSRPLRWLGEISYSLYMSHALAQYLARQLCKRFEIPGLTEATRGRLPLGVALVAYVLVTLVTLLLARASYRAVEAPLRDLARRRIGNWMQRLASSAAPAP